VSVSSSHMVPLPALREDLSLHRGPHDRTGAPTWTIRDPVRNRHFRIGWPAFEMLLRWHLGSPEAIAGAVAAETALRVDGEAVNELLRFLSANQLVQPAGHDDVLRRARIADASRHGWAAALLHNYLFFRIPLARPDRFLDATLGWVAWLGTPLFRLLTLAALVAGLGLALRQWDKFVASLVDTLTLSGMASYGVALSLVKIIHECAHAYTAKRFGCRVPTMGLAFLVLWPVLYTDVNETWELASRRQRLLVGAAGILAELTVAAWATLAWAFLPDGALREACFVLAAITWASSLAINLSPFMRFDGYFLLMDGLEMPNLHPRAFAMGRWWLREVLFGLREPPPEPLPVVHRRVLTAFAVGVWLYRLVLFLGIAALVYHFFIKAVGVILFGVEIGWFVLLPIVRELREWRRRRQAITGSARARLSVTAVVIIVLAAAIPWQSRIQAPAIARAGQSHPLYLPFPARLQEIHVARGTRVSAGQPLMTFTAPDIAERQRQLVTRVHGKQREWEAAQMETGQSARLGVLRQEIAKAQAELAALKAESNRVILVAPGDGVLMDVLPDLAPGQWLSPVQKLALVRSDTEAVGIAYVQEDQRQRLTIGSRATFIPQSLDYPDIPARIESIEPTPVRTLADASLASVHGGQLPARVERSAIIPEGAVYRVTLRLEGPPPDVELAGTAVLSGERSSLLGQVGRSILVVLVREWGT
jgi:putative peptide zinc metalloprotease protein